jgi:hypothetical protein
VGLEVGDQTVLQLRVDGEDRRLTVGSDEWDRTGSLAFGGRLSPAGEEPVAASGAWTDDDTYTVKARFYKAPFCATMRLEFAGDVLLFDQEMNVGFGPTKRPQLVGRQEK